MDIGKINEGDVVKNYKEMCNLLGEDIMDGNSKKAQLKKWERYFCFHKEGHKFFIDKIYDFPLKKELNNNSIYAKDIESILTYELMEKENYTGNYTKNNLFLILGMVNKNYLINKHYIVSDELKQYQYWEIQHFYGRVDQKLSNILFSTLNSMVRRGLIEYKKRYVIVENKMHDIRRYANEKEIENILKIKSEILESMGCARIPFTKSNQYYNKVNRVLKELYGWEKIFTEYQITYNRSYMKSNKETIERDLMDGIQERRRNLNSNIIQAVKRQARKLAAKQG